MKLQYSKSKTVSIAGFVNRSLDKNIDLIWTGGKSDGRIDWLGLEQTIRNIYREYSGANGIANVDQATVLILISETVAAYTGHGACL